MASKKCSVSNGSGQGSGSCYKCGGSGKTDDGQWSCPHCNGTGRGQCPNCYGSGMEADYSSGGSSSSSGGSSDLGEYLNKMLEKAEAQMGKGDYHGAIKTLESAYLGVAKDEFLDWMPSGVKSLLSHCYIEYAGQLREQGDTPLAFFNYLKALAYHVYDNSEYEFDKMFMKKILHLINDKALDLNDRACVARIGSFLGEVKYKIIDEELQKMIALTIFLMEQEANNGNMNALILVMVAYHGFFTSASSLLTKKLYADRNENAQTVAEKHREICLKYAKLGNHEALFLMGRYFPDYDLDGKKSGKGSKYWYEKAYDLKTGAGSKLADAELTDINEGKSKIQRTIIGVVLSAIVGYLITALLDWCFHNWSGMTENLEQKHFLISMGISAAVFLFAWLRRNYVLLVILFLLAALGGYVLFAKPSF